MIQTKFHRRSIRLKEYDYCVGAYFVTMVAQRRKCLFGEITNGEMLLNEFGRIAAECWHVIPEHFPNAELGAYIVMPNHVHGIIVIHENESLSTAGAQHAAPLPSPPNVKPGSLGAIIRSYRSAVTRRIGCELNAKNIWQRNYYERVIRNEKECDRIHRYIESNPSHWAEDKENLS